MLGVPGNTMPGTRYQPEKLRTREQEVEYLRDEEQQERLGEVGLDADHRKRHARDVAERIAGKRARGIPTYPHPCSLDGGCRACVRADSPVVVHEARTNRHQRQHEVQAEQVPLDELLAPIRHPRPPHSADLHIRSVPQQVQGYPEIERPRQVEKIVQDDGQCDDERLANFRAVDAREDVEAIGRESAQERHVDVV